MKWEREDYHKSKTQAKNVHEKTRNEILLTGREDADALSFVFGHGRELIAEKNRVWLTEF